MSPEPIRYASASFDLADRFQQYSVVDASPAAGAETVIATLTLANFADLAIVSGIHLRGWAAFTVGTSGVSANLRIRQTNVSGTVVVASGATTVSAGNLLVREAYGFDATPGVGVYVLTFQVGSGAAESTVSALSISAVLV